MNRESESRLLEFCAVQHDSFCMDEWLTFQHPDKEELLAACLFLAGVHWFGHKASLLEIAARLQPHSADPLADLVKRTGFDCLRFSTMLRRELTHASVAP